MKLNAYVMITVAFCCTCSVVVDAYLPGLAAKIYCTGAIDADNVKCEKDIKVYANRLNSDETVVPYEYSNTGFDFCKPKDDSVPTENLGQVLFGERIEASNYSMTFKKNESCKVACVKTYKKGITKDKSILAFIRRAIQNNYQHHWIVDNMPATWCFPTRRSDKGEKTEEYCMTGFPLGCFSKTTSDTKNICPIKYDANTYYLLNHVDIRVEYHSSVGTDWGNMLDQEGGRIVAVKISPRSIKAFNKDSETCGTGLLEIPVDVTSDLSFTYSYSVKFVMNNEIVWASRWDYILNAMPKPSIQWVSIVNSMVIVLFLSGMVAMIMMRTLYRDIARYNQMDNVEDAQEEFGWKLVHGDVFRSPRKGMLLAVFCGSGTQIFFMSLITLVVAWFGFLSPANRGAFTTTGLVLYVCLGTPAGYVSARIYKSFGGERWKFNVLLTALLCPGVVFAMFFILNFILWVKGSSAAIPFSTLVALLALWFGISVPLTFIGAYCGFKKHVIEHPVRTNQIPRQIPVTSFYTKPLPGIVMGGVLPFGCIFIQLFFILTSIWSHKTFYMFGLLFLVFVILVITCSEATILLCYFHLCAEDYHWWWRAFLTSGSTAFYFFIYCIHFFFVKLEMRGIVSMVLYFGYSLIIMFLFFMLTGTIGFISTFWFVRKIYGSVKVD